MTAGLTGTDPLARADGAPQDVTSKPSQQATRRTVLIAGAANLAAAAVAEGTSFVRAYSQLPRSGCR